LRRFISPRKALILRTPFACAIALVAALTLPGCLPMQPTAAEGKALPSAVSYTHRNEPGAEPTVLKPAAIAPARESEAPQAKESRALQAKAPGEPAGTKSVALTLDLGPWADPDIAKGILAVLKEKDVPATLFISGKFAEKHAGVVAEAVEEGHPLGNHTYSHPDLTKLSPEQVSEEVDKAQSLIEKAAGHKVTPLYFRPPYGALSQKIRRVVESAGYCLVLWTVDALDWQKGASTQKVEDRVIAKARGDAIILMHITRFTQEALPVIVERLRASGYKFVNLEEVSKEPQKQ